MTTALQGKQIAIPAVDGGGRVELEQARAGQSAKAEVGAL